MTDVQGRTAFITGGANGIGLGIARVFAREGVKLALADLDTDALASAKAELEGVTPVETYTLDVRDRDAFAATADAAEAALGPVTLLFNNAGVAAGGPIGAMTYDMWDFGMGINANGVINGVQTFLSRMIAHGQGGHIVNTASGAGLAGVTSAVYTMSKFAVVGLTETMARDLAEEKIGVSVLCPGPVATGIVQRTADAAPKIAFTDEVRERVAQAKAMSAAMLQYGVSIDAVGDMVLKAVRDNALYIHTDRTMEAIIRTRTEKLLAAYDALPA